MNKVFCFGEPLLRMSPALQGAWIRDRSMPVYIGGSELNVASALATWKQPVKFGSVLPDNYLSKDIVAALSEKGIDTSAIRFAGNRMGIYFLPSGADLQNHGVIYDREESSFAELSPGRVDWETALQDCNWFHFTAITPALNKNAAAVCREALFYASKKEMTISIDLNFRPALWKFDQRPVQVMPELAAYCQVMTGNIWSAATLLGIPLDEKIHEEKSQQAYIDHANRTAKGIFTQYPQCKTVANTFRFDREEGIHYFATLNEKDAQKVSPEFQTDKVVDRVGSGDCFMAGLIYGLSSGKSSQEVINYAAAAAFGKLQEKGDFTDQTIEAVEEIIKRYEKS